MMELFGLEFPDVTKPDEKKADDGKDANGNDLPFGDVPDEEGEGDYKDPLEEDEN